MDNLITLTMKEHTRFQTIQKLIEKKISEEEARKLIGLKSVRQIRRIKKKVIDKGVQGIVHLSRGKPSNRKISEKLRAKAMALIKEKYYDFKPTFAAEKLLENHSIKISSETLRKLMIKDGIWKAKSRKKPKKRHVWRERRSNYGEMQQFDGSYHKWFEERGEECCLLLSVDDATGAITKAKFDKNEGVKAVYKFWWEYAEENGLPLSIYLDKFSTYKINHPSAEDNKDLKTQFQRAMQQLEVKLITAHSPEAKGRVERMNATLQDRLVKEMRLKNISTMEEANIFLKKFIPKFNKKFSVQPKEQKNLHKQIPKHLQKQLPQIFSIQSQRKVHNDYTIMFKTRFYQLEEKQPTTVFKKDIVTIEEHLDGEIKVNMKGHSLNYKELPERPKKKHIPVCALTSQRSEWIPSSDHPWRKFKHTKKQARRDRTEGKLVAV